MITPIATQFVDRLAELRFEATFNPYSETCTEHNRTGAPAIRRRNLELVLSAALTNGIHSLWVARDLGYRGGRRTGLAMTDDVCLPLHEKMSGVQGLRRPTAGPPMPERTASVIWQMIGALKKPVFLWNVFPLHPHEPNDPLSNRCHTRRERHSCAPLLTWLVENLRPNMIVAVGKDAESALSELDFSCKSVRHPSYGGQTDFFMQSASIYGVSAPALKSKVPKSGAQMSLM